MYVSDRIECHSKCRIHTLQPQRSVLETLHAVSVIERGRTHAVTEYVARSFGLSGNQSSQLLVMRHDLGKVNLTQ